MQALNLRRRLRQLRLPALIVGPLALALVIYTMFVEPRMIEITHHDIAIRNLPSEFEGFRIVQLTDIHTGFWVTNDDVRQFVALANAEEPHIVVLTGDFLTRLSKDIPGTGKALGDLKTKHGMYAVLGNHDYWEDEDAITEALSNNGIDVLFDEAREIRVGEGRLMVVGTDDLWEGAPDFDKAFEDVEDSDACIALAHNPDAAMHMDGRLVDLALAGHTHGGLVVLPGIGALLSSSGLGRKVVSGLHEVNEVRMYISRGLGRGSTVVPCRFRCRPEIAVFRLHRAGK